MEVSRRILVFDYSNTTDKKRVRPLAMLKRWKAARRLEMRRGRTGEERKND
jgi:hypothetical protein